MASSMTQYPFLSNILIKPSTETTHRRNITLIRALKDDDSQQQDPVKLALARAKAYKKSIQSNPTPKIAQDPDPVSKNSEFGQNKDGSISIEDKNKGFEEVNEFDVIDKKDEPKVSAIDFVGLGFADKKEGRGLPAGLIPISDPFPSGDLPDVEIIVGDTSNFGKEKTSNSSATTEDETELYKPKVSTWGVFPRPNNISKTYGGGKTIRPGEVLETAESKAAKQARTRQMIAAYNRQMGLLIDPKLKAECEKDLKDGDYLMEMGKLKDAIPFYEKVMGNLVYQSELHGLAALQWSICQDSLNRSNEARAMYEKLQSHPNVGVSKKARQFVFSFQAMEMLKVTSSSVSKRKTGYQNFFDAFVENKNNLSANEIEGEDDAVTQALPYVIFLVSPIFMILVIAVQKRLL
ncbi:hypothetical protein HanOQP8_Chr16g0632121 [Helianthus annuus]|nr:hypothetical protein HanIR_Chr16g0833971 [Helianthus annuus]KAJ0461895.1 hypothetical protein HanHA89_Chr16g0677471 [Helianthus annuus]KAJ0646164.1 hypothetical protein HanOQP8_Chr16g0632121 [Helianthus annuus]KAJ0822815.1 hypothetical protein HanPSC8_Chr16g0736481 [Helianthus annuus]